MKMRNLLQTLRKSTSMLTVSVCTIFSISTEGFSRVGADPDFISTGISWSGSGQAKLGDYFTWGPVSIGGMVVIRNEKRFNQGLLPNHNWRGFVCIDYTFDPQFFSKRGMSLGIGIEHESAHPTMGIREEPRDAFHMIYDGTYRRYMLNSVSLTLRKIREVSSLTIGVEADYQFYFFSKNTPELPTMTTGCTNGVSVGGEINGTIGKLTLFASLFDRYIFEGNRRDYGRIYHNSSSGILSDTVSTPVLNSMNSIVVKVGCALPALNESRLVRIYGSFLYGNVFGFIDSRETRRVLRIGLEISQ